MLYIGVDLAWGMGRGMTGLAAVDDEGDLADVARVGPDADILSWLAPMTAGPCLVAIDAPIVVRNATGNRACEKLVGRYFGGYGASCHSANTANPAFSGGTRALRLTDNLGMDIDPGSAAERRAIEVYPHPAIVALFGLPSIVQYKNKPGRSLGLLRAEMQRLLGLLEGLESDPVPLRVRACPGWSEIRRAVDTAAAKAALGRVEDSVDAVVCAYVARLAHLAPARVRTLGTVSDGYILTPVTPQIAARIDADPNRGQPTATPQRASMATASATLDTRVPHPGCHRPSGQLGAGEIDAYDMDETIHHYHRAAGELWKFCFSRGGSGHAELIGGILDRMTADAEAIDWWERATPPRRQ